MSRSLLPRWILGAFVIGGIAFGLLYVSVRTGSKTPPLDRMIGQMLMFGFRGVSARDVDPKRLAAELHHGRIGGVLMLGPNFSNREDVKGLTRLFRESVERKGRRAFLALDMEGGLVQRLGPKLGYDALPSAEAIGATMTVEEARRQFRKTAIMVREAGFNINLAPVVDLGGQPDNPLVSTHRTYSSDASVVTAYARAFIQEQRAENILPVLKHFPGHGSSRTDTHDGLVDISASWTPNELKPFRSLIASGDAKAVMTGHLTNNKIALDGYPVSLSKTAIQGCLRHDLKFDGLVFSDDLQMIAIEQKYGLNEAVIRAITAGTDVLVIVNSSKPDPNLAQKLIALVQQAVADGRIEKKTIEAAWRRISRAKSEMSATPAR